MTRRGPRRPKVELKARIRRWRAMCSQQRLESLKARIEEAISRKREADDGPAGGDEHGAEVSSRHQDQPDRNISSTNYRNNNLPTEEAMSEPRQREVGGRRLPYEVGSTRYDDDPFRGQRRRPWMCFRVGTPSMEFSPEYFMKFVGKVHSSMIEAGILLDGHREFLKFTCVDADYPLLRREMREGLDKCAKIYETGPLSIPIVILILDQYEIEELDNVVDEYCERAHFFKLNRDEILQWIADMEYEELDEECVQFAQHLKASEGLVESIAMRLPIDEKVCTFGKRLDIADADVGEDAQEHNRKMQLQIQQQMRRDAMMSQSSPQRQQQRQMSRALAPPGLPPPGIRATTGSSRSSVMTSSSPGPYNTRQQGSSTASSQQQQQFVPPPPGLSSHGHGPPGLSNGPTHSGPPPGISLQRPPGILDRPQSRAQSQMSSLSFTLSDDYPPSSSSRQTQLEQERKEPEVNGSHILSFEDVRAARNACIDSDTAERGLPTRKHESEMAKYINGTKLYERFEHPFVDITHNLDLLYVINFAVSSRKPDIQESSKAILRGAFRREFPVKLKRKFLDRPFDSGRWSDDAAELFYEIVNMYFNTARFKKGYMLTIESFLDSWLDLLHSYNRCNPAGLRAVGVSSKELSNLRKLMDHVDKWIQSAKEAREQEIQEENRQKMIQSHTQNPQNQPKYQEEPQRRVLVEEQRNGREQETSYGFRRQPETVVRPQVRITRTQDDVPNYSINYSLNSEDFKISSDGSRNSTRREEEFRRPDDYRRPTDYRMADEESLNRRRDENFRKSEETRRRYDIDTETRRRDEQQPLGFHNGGGTVDIDNDYPSIDISDSDVQVVEGDDAPEDDPVDVEEDFRVFPPATNSANSDEKPKQPLNSDEKPKQPYKYNDDEYEPPYWKCEQMEPPEDFKTLTSVPIMSDYVNPVEPFLRRIQELGVYKNTQHYLDVQFRLLREDLVSPLRDGIDIYRKNGTCKGRRLEGAPCSDISIVNIEKVDGKQVTERDGFEMRIIWPSPFDRDKLLENDREMKELGLVMLSGDGFVDDFHLGHIQTSLLGTRGCLHFAIHEETAPFIPNKSYQMAQASSYLPSYKHVLENLKTISPFKPIPFERYIVYGKKEIFRPNFQRFDKTEQQVSDEKKLERIYTDLRSHTASKRYMSGKPIPKGIDDDDDDDYRFVQSKILKKEEMDLEYRQLQEPIFRSMLGVDTKGSDLIKIGRKMYHISRLLDEFHPPNMDESQRKAFCDTFRRELSLIQGPPGTGKTHIGVQIVKTMLHNRIHWKMTEPILVVCFTNSGLDNLLERIYQMIEDDEELSKDNGKPKMIRYGRKCESEFLKRRNVMRYEVHEQYRSVVSEGAQKEQSRAGANKRKKANDLVVSSFTLFCSRNDLLSYEILSRVMDPNHQQEIQQFAYEHIDTKENPLNCDEALACWLLDRDFGKATKAQTKKAKKTKFQGVPDDSDDEKRDFLTVEDSDDEDNDEELDDEKLLDKLFNKMNLECSGKDLLGAVNASAGDEYYTRGVWEVTGETQPQMVVLMGKKVKQVNGNAPVDESINNLVKEVKEMILSSQPVPKHELEDIKYIFSLARPKRWSLYVTWCDAVRNLVVDCLPKQIQDYRQACINMQAAQDKVDAEIMKMPMIIGATTTGCSRLRPVLEKVEPRILIVEEAAEVLEAHIVSAMISSIEHCVMIGDHKQLRPNPAVHELGTEYGMRISMFERLVERGLPYSQLQEQHRMNTMISDLIVKPSFYENVRDAENVLTYPDVEGMAANLFFWSHVIKEETPDGVSWMNRQEAYMAAELVKHLLKQSYTHSDIVVLATYSAQRNYMYRDYPSVFGPTSEMLVPVETVDSFQGKERKIAIVSLVRSHRGVHENTGIGFLAVANRICVALTRAQHGMYIIGNGGYIRNNANLWDKIVERLDHNGLIAFEIPLRCVAHGRLTHVKQPQDFAEKSPEGGCLEICGIEKVCGHYCRRRCHPRVDYEHDQRCEYTCEKKCPNPAFQHSCAKRCFEECGSCMFLVEIPLECGHLVTTPCSRIKMTKCDQQCTKKIACGHRCSGSCGADCIDSSECREMVSMELECGHLKSIMCGVLTSSPDPDLRCMQRCENQMLTCAHQCAELCGEPCTLECQEIVNITLKCQHSQDVICSSYNEKMIDQIECLSKVPKTLTPCGHIEPIGCSQDPTTELCNRPCTKILKDCGHMCSNRCGECFVSQHHICQQRCQKVLECGHTCSAKCGEPCPPCKAFCTNTCEHQSCGAGERGFGRECNKLCVMCISNCANKCVHRSCTMKCFEECNVKTCAEPCTEKLKCQHACLGMCGEKCPKICGTCERSKYLECVSGRSTTSSLQRVHRLIMIPKCHHIFPVEQLDEHVKTQKERRETLRCPKCSAILSGILRYAKYTKRHYLDENMKKLKSNIRSIHQTTIEAEIDKCTRRIQEELHMVQSNLNNDCIKILQKFISNIQEIVNSAAAYQGKADQKWRLAFLLDVGKCHLAIARLISMSAKQRISRRKDVPPTVDLMFHRCMGDIPFVRIFDELKKTNEHVSDTFKTCMLGAVLPKLRFHVAKMTILQELSSMCHQLVLEKRDISDPEARVISSNCNLFINGLETMNMTSSFNTFETTILAKIVPKVTETGGTGRRFWSWSALKVPEL